MNRIMMNALLMRSKRTNWALNTNGATVPSIDGSLSFGVKENIIKGNRGYTAGDLSDKILAFSNANTHNPVIQIQFPSFKKIDSIYLFSNYMASTGTSPLEPTETELAETFFNQIWSIQYYNGSFLVDIINQETEEATFYNNKIWAKVQFPEINTNLLQIYIGNSSFNSLFLIGIEAWGS